MGPPSRASSMRPPPDPLSRFPLMTPSASPPVQRPFSRQSSTPSPAKKRRVSRAPSVPTSNLRSFSVASASPSSVSPAFNFDPSVDPAEELDLARRASSFRVLDVWSQLAEKYVKRLDEDDIVDLGKGTIIRDCGVLRSSNDMFEIGYFTEERENAERLDNGQPLTPADDEPDELDAFADVQDNVSRSETDGDDEDGFGLAQHTKRLPPVRELDPADAADLAEFLKAEQLRRETFGDLDEEDGEDETEQDGEVEYGEESDEQEELDGIDGATECESRTSGDDEESLYQERVHDSDGNKQDYSRLSTPSGSPEFDILELSNAEKGTEEPDVDAESGVEEPLGADSGPDSDDELGGWERDEGSILYSVTEFSEDLAEAEKRAPSKGASPPATPDPPPKPRKKRGRSRGKVQDDEPSDKRSEIRNQSKSPSKKAIVSPPPTVTQLQTPPRSASFGPEGSNIKITTTYTRKRRGHCSSPRKTPLRIQSTASEDSASESESAPSPSKSQKQKQSSPLHASPTKKMKLVPEVVIDVYNASTPGRTSKNEPTDEGPDRSTSTHGEPISRLRRLRPKGKVKANDADQPTLHRADGETEPRSPSSDEPDVPAPTLSHDSIGRVRTGSPKKTLSTSSKRRRGSSLVQDEPDEIPETIDVVMSSPTLTPARSDSRRISSSRRSIVKAVESFGENEPGPSSPRPRGTSSNHRSRSRPSAEHGPEVLSHPHPLPEISNFSFAPPQPSHLQYPRYPPSHYPHGLVHQNPVPLPNLQDPNAQFHLAQALQSLSILMGGALPFPPSPIHASHPHHQPSLFPQHGHQGWSPYTPQHHNRTMVFDTPQSVASDPPPSSPPRSDYSDSLPSSPIKQAVNERGRSQMHLSSSAKDRPKSAIRETKTQSRSRSRSSRRVSFSSPEATQIEDHAYDYVSEDVIEIGSSDGEDSDFERRRVRREQQSSQSLELHVRAQTPGPPNRNAKSEVVEGDSRHSTRGEQKRRHSRARRTEETSHHRDGRRYR